MTTSINGEITLDLIVAKNCSDKNAPDLEVQLPKLRRIWLDSTKITRIDNLEMLGNVTHLYLHNNKLTSIQNLETLCFTLKHLNLKGNLITNIGNGLLVLEHLMSLDISNNKLETLDSRELPKCLRFINFLNNPVLDSPDFNEDALIDELPSLKVCNNDVIDDDDDSNDEDDEIGDHKDVVSNQEDSDDVCLQDITKSLRETSKVRQRVLEERHAERINTLKSLKEIQMEQRNQDLCPILDSVENTDRTEVLSRNSLPPLERPPSSKSLLLLKQIPPLHHPPSQKPAQSAASSGTTPRVNSPKRLSSLPKNVAPTLRQPLETELIKCDDFDDYLKNVNKQFSDLRSGVKSLDTKENQS